MMTVAMTIKISYLKLVIGNVVCVLSDSQLVCVIS